MADDFFNPTGRGGVNPVDAFNAGAKIVEDKRQLKLQKGQDFLALDKQRQGALFQDAQSINTFLKAGQQGKALGVLSHRMDIIDQIGGDSGDTREIADFIARGDIKGATNLLDSVESVGIQQGFLTDPQAENRKKQGSRTANKKDFDTFQELLSTSKQTGTDEDKEKARQFGLKAGFFKSTEQETADIKISAAEKRAIAKANVARKQGFISSGVEAADGVANIKKSLVLLRDIKTGGFDNFKLRASQFFGVEGADAAELSANLGKNVLGQLKNIFGSAFTEKEGARLERIEAGFGKSTEGNIRLLENALKIADRSARRGIAAAEDQGADFTAGEIREALKFDFSLPDQQASPLPAQQSTPTTVGRFQIEVQ